MTAICCVCGQSVRVSKGVLIKHRDAHNHVCDNAGCDVEANERGRDRWRCLDCGRTCTSQDELKAHVLLVHADPVPQADLVERLRDPWERGSMKAVNMHDEAADEIEALRGAVRSLAGWVRELDPHPSLDPCEYLTDKSEQSATRRAFASGCNGSSRAPGGEG